MKIKWLFISVLVVLLVFVFVGCSENDNQSKETAFFAKTDNDITVNLLTENMKSLAKTKAEKKLSDVIAAKISNKVIDFSDITCSDDTVNVGDAIYIEGIIPETDYPEDRIVAWAEPNDIVDFENFYLTNKDGSTVLTSDIVGKKAGQTKIFIHTEDGENIYSFELEVTESVNRSMPSNSGYTVYCTPTGGKYHTYMCSYLRGNGIPISHDEALAKGLGPCSRCRP